jgi:tetratricopeptide (TPR) repeat protein
MPPTLSDKLKALGVQVGARNLAPPSAAPVDFPIEAVVAGRLHSTELGPVFITETATPPRTGMAGWGCGRKRRCRRWRPGRRSLGWPGCRWSSGPFWTPRLPVGRGAGTYAFLIGAARFEGDSFRLAQFFMRNPTEEPAQLAALTEFLRPCAALVTFNGKAFDAPLLNTRYILNGQRSPLPGMAHLDLLPLARRLWRDRLPSRRLTSLERDILLLERTTEDVPGFLIPQLYFDYLRGGDARPLSGVFYHNRLDVVAMAALLNQMAQMLADPLGEAVEFALDLIAIGKAFEAAGQLEEAARLFAAGLNRPDLPEAHYWETQERLSLLEKRRENWEAALAVWRMAAEGRRIYAHVELAKYYEHKTRDYPAALHWTEAALALLHRPTAGRAERAQWLAELQHRQERLQRKVTQPK